MLVTSRGLTGRVKNKFKKGRKEKKRERERERERDFILIAHKGTHKTKPSEDLKITLDKR